MKTLGKVLLTTTAQMSVTLVVFFVVLTYLSINNEAQRTGLSPEEMEEVERTASKVEDKAPAIAFGLAIVSGTAVATLGVLSIRKDRREKEETND